jgi:hypothetical protein
MCQHILSVAKTIIADLETTFVRLVNRPEKCRNLNYSVQFQQYVVFLWSISAPELLLYKTPSYQHKTWRLNA